MFDQAKPFDRTIRFRNNRIRTFGNRIVWAERVDGLEITGNTIIQTHDAPILHPDAPMIELAHCRDTRVEGNSYEGTNSHSLSCDAGSEATLVLQDNEGFSRIP